MTHADATNSELCDHQSNGEELSFDYSSFDVSGSPELSLIVCTPSPKNDEDKIWQLLQSKSIRFDY
ncbi:hypothetical protein ACOV11_16840 [Vibrio natriegens]